MSKIKACAYLRMSTDEQVHSIQIQQEEIEKFAERNGYEIENWYIDKGRSGSRNTELRTEFYRLFADAADAEWKMIICLNRSRFSRLDCVEEAPFKLRLRELGISLVTVHEGEMNWSTSVGRITDAIHTEAANDYAVKVGKATLRGKLQAFKEGRFSCQCCFGLARQITDPTGEVRTFGRQGVFTRPKGWTQVWVPGDPDEIKTVQFVFETYVANDVGFKWIAQQLNEKGISAPEGGLWNANVVGRMLKNPVYVGDSRLGKTVSGKFFRLDGDQIVTSDFGERFKAKEGIVRQGTHVGIIERDLWNAVQAKLERRHMQLPVRARGDDGYALSGIMFCGHCGGRLYGRRNCHNNNSGIVGYCCSSFLKYGRRSGCSGWTIDEREILPSVIDKLTQEVDARLLKLGSIQPPQFEQQRLGELTVLKKERAKLAGEIVTGTERLLICDHSLLTELQSRLLEMKTKCELLDEKIKRAQSPITQLDQQLKDWEAWLSASKKNMIHIQSSPQKGTKIPPGLRFTPASFREMSLRYGLKITCWWQTRSKKRWDVVRVAIHLGSPEPQNNSTVTSPVCDTQLATSRPVEIAYCMNEIDVVFSGRDLFPHSASSIDELIDELRKEGKTQAEIAEILNDRKIPPPLCEIWTASTLQNFRRAHRFRKEL